MEEGKVTEESAEDRYARQLRNGLLLWDIRRAAALSARLSGIRLWLTYKATSGQ